MSEQPQQGPDEQPKGTYLGGIVDALKKLGKAILGGYWGGV